MAIEVRWDDDSCRIIRWTFPKQWAWDEFYGALQVSRALVREKRHIVDVIVDMSQSVYLPRNVLTQSQVTMQTASLNIGIIVVIGFNPLLRAAFNSFQRIYRATLNHSAREMHIVNLEYKAYEIIHARQAQR
jgi:hypothetical protein